MPKTRKPQQDPRQQSTLPAVEPAPAPPRIESSMEAQRRITIRGALDVIERAAGNVLPDEGARARAAFDQAIAAMLKTHDIDALPHLWYDAYKIGCEHAYALTAYVLQVRRAALQAEIDAKKRETSERREET